MSCFLAYIMGVLTVPLIGFLVIISSLSRFGFRWV